MAFKTEIAFVKSIPAGTPISYGRTFISDRPMRVATLCVGYADGYSRLLSNKGEVLVRGKRARVLGRVCMDMIVIDVSDIPDAGIGDEVVLFGSQKGEQIFVDELADKIGTINYEIVCGIGRRVPRIYNREGKRRQG
jgi:alanine racemase